MLVFDHHDIEVLGDDLILCLSGWREGDEEEDLLLRKFRIKIVDALLLAAELQDAAALA